MIYLDNAATTRLYDECLEDYRRYGCERFFNPSALYGAALGCANSVKQARAAIARTLGADADELYFTASGSESDNIALFCSVRPKRGKIIIGNCEHSAVYQSAKELSARGYEVVFAPCDRYGRCDADALERLLDDSVVLVSVMHVCNETGAINDIAAIAAMTREKSPYALVHSDGVQTYCKIPVSVKALDVDLYSISAHKIHGPKGIGALYCRRGLHLKSFVFGGGQEGNVRSATENTASIAAFARAAERSFDALAQNASKTRSLRDALITELIALSDVQINTDPMHAAPHIVNFALKDARGEVVVHCMEDSGILIGTGSACSSHKGGKRIARALGFADTSYADGILRVSFCEENEKDDVTAFVAALKKIKAQLSAYQKI